MSNLSILDQRGDQGKKVKKIQNFFFELGTKNKYCRREKTIVKKQNVQKRPRKKAITISKGPKYLDHPVVQGVCSAQRAASGGQWRQIRKCDQMFDNMFSLLEP